MMIFKKKEKEFDVTETLENDKEAGGAIRTFTGKTGLIISALLFALAFFSIYVNSLMNIQKSIGMRYSRHLF